MRDWAEEEVQIIRHEHMQDWPSAVCISIAAALRNAEKQGARGETRIDAWESGYTVAREQAAELADAHAPTSPPGVVDTRVIHGAGMAATIATAIRSMKPQP